MNKGIIFAIILFFILVGGLGFLYYFYEVPKQEQIKNGHANLSISAQFEGRKIKTNYTILYNNVIIQGTTIKDFYELERVPKNNTIKVYNKNIENQSFYSDLKEIKNIKNITYRVDLKLIEPKEVTVESEEINSTINIKISSEEFRDIKFCIGWSVHYIFVRPLEEFEKIEKPDLYKTFDKCFDANKSLKSDELEINLEYEQFGILKDYDYIELLIMDSDFINGEEKTEHDGKDLGGENIIIKLK